MRLVPTLPLAALVALAGLSCSCSSATGSSGGSSGKSSSSGSAGNSGSGSSSGNPGQSLGEECGGAKTCASGLTCIGQLPGGYCSAPCNPAACPSGGSCIEALPGEFACGLACSGNADCTRAGYACDPSCQVCVPAIAVGQVSCPPNFAGGGGHLPDGGACGVAPAPGQLTWTPSVDTSASAATANEIEGAGAASPLDAGYVVVAYETTVLEDDDAGPSGSIGVSVSADDGKTFTVAPPLSGPGDDDVDAYDPSVGVDANGEFYLTWGAFDGNGVGHVWLATSYGAADGGGGGLGWTTPKDILGAAGFAGGGVDKPVLAMNPSPSDTVPVGAYVVMGTFTGSFGGSGPYQIQLVQVLPGGLGWDPLVEVDDSPTTQRAAWRDLPAIDFDTAGNAYVAWVEYDGAQGEQIIIDDQVVGAQIVGYSGAAIWFSLVQCQLGGAVPGKNVPVSVPGNNVVLDVPRIVAAPDGSMLYAVYTAASTGAPNVTNILLATSSDQGTSWSVSQTPINAALSDAAACSTNFHPAAFLDSQGRLWVSWVSNVDGTGSVLYAVSSDQGNTFSAPAPISDQPFSFNTQLGISSSLGGYQSLFGGPGQLFSVWAGAPTNAGGFPPSHVFLQQAGL